MSRKPFARCFPQRRCWRGRPRDRYIMRAGKQEIAALFDSGAKLVPDEELERLAEEAGPSSVAAAMLKELRNSRAKDRQVFAFHINECFFIGPIPDAKTEADLLAIAELTDVTS